MKGIELIIRNIWAEGWMEHFDGGAQARPLTRDEDVDKYKAQLRALVDEVIGEDEPLPSSKGMHYSTDGMRNENVVIQLNREKAQQRQRADELFGVQQPYAAGHGGYDENFNADAELDHKTDIGETDDN